MVLPYVHWSCDLVRNRDPGSAGLPQLELPAVMSTLDRFEREAESLFRPGVSEQLDQAMIPKTA